MEESERSGADVVYGDCVTVDREGRVIGLRPQHPFSRLILRLYEPLVNAVRTRRWLGGWLTASMRTAGRGAM